MKTSKTTWDNGEGNFDFNNIVWNFVQNTNNK